MCCRCDAAECAKVDVSVAELVGQHVEHQADSTAAFQLFMGDQPGRVGSFADIFENRDHLRRLRCNLIVHHAHSQPLPRQRPCDTAIPSGELELIFSDAQTHSL